MEVPIGLTLCAAVCYFKVTGAKQVLIEPGVTDFSKIVNAVTFIDKSLLIERLLNNGSGVITAPTGFGKSTNLDMVKRFFEITVDRNGEPMPVNATENYKLFKVNNLRICEKEDFFNEHFGKHPVVYIDFSELCGVTDIVDFLTKIREILTKTYEPHAYLLNSTEYFTRLEAERWIGAFNDSSKYQRLTTFAIWNGFKKLVEFLHRHFERKVFILINEYNTFLDEVLKTKNPDRKRMVSFIEEVNRGLFRGNDFVDQTVIMGVPLDKYKGNLKTKYLKSFKFLNNHVLWSYFGITESELDRMLRSLVKENEREHVKRALDKEREKLQKQLFDQKYIKKLSGSENITIYSFSSTLNILRNMTSI